MVPVGVGNFFQRSHVAIDVGAVWWQEVSLQLVLQEHMVLRRKAEARPEKKPGNSQPLSLKERHKYIVHHLKSITLLLNVKPKIWGQCAEIQKRGSPGFVLKLVDTS